MQPKTHRLISVLLLAVLLLSLAAPTLAQEASTAAPAADAGAVKAACAALTEAEQQEFDSLTAMKAAETLAGADLARYEALAQQMNCYNAQFAVPAQPDQPRGATPAAPVAPGVCETAGPIEVEGTILGTTPTAYATLGAAFAAINNGVHTGAISIDVCGDTSEGTATATLNASGSGAASYTSITMVPAGGAARTISGATTGGNPMIDFNGADNVTVDGINTGGNALTIANTRVSNLSGTSTIRFIGGATNNTIKNSTIQGSGTMSVATDGATIFFSTDGVTANGNDSNKISNNNIGPAGANLPTKAILGNGSTTTTAIGNSHITIENNNIYDYFSAGQASSGIAVNGGCNIWAIRNNKFYQTALRTWSIGGGHAHRGIFINSTTPSSGAQGFFITGNTIGYASSAGTGTYSLTGSLGTGSGTFAGIVFNGITEGDVSTISNNTIASVSLTGVTSSGTGASSPFMGIMVQSGVANTNNNTIGSQSATDSLTFATSTTSSTDVHGIYNSSSDNWTAIGNTIGGLSVTNTAASDTFVVYGLRANTSTVDNFTATSNTVGGTVADSIRLNAIGASSQIVGITTANAAATFTSNTIRNLTTNIGTGTSTAASMIGMLINTSLRNHTLSQNIIYNLTNTNPFAASVVTGIQFNGDSANVVERNLIYGLTAATNSASAEVNGIRVAGGTTIYRNNMIALGAGIANALGAAATNSSVAGINGINEFLGTNQFFHNSVYIGGTATAGSGSSYAFNGVQTTNTRSFRDNIFFNARTNSGATGKHYAVKINGAAPNPTGLTINNNVYFANGSGAVFGFFNSADVANLAAWKTAVGQDALSFESNPQYNDPTNAVPDLHLNPTIATVAEGNGVDVGVVNDFDGQTRATLTPVDIGADAADLIPLVVTLASFDALGGADRVTISWQTVSESDNAGFNLYRSTDPAGPQTLLSYIPSQAPGSTQGFAYSYEDLAVQPGETYWYWLEDVSLSGATTLHGPVSATVQAPTAVTLSGISAGQTGEADTFLARLWAALLAWSAVALQPR